MIKENSNKRLNKKEKAEAERRKEEAQLLGNFIEGESNIDNEKLDWNDIGKLVFSDGLSIEEKERLLGKPLPLLTKEEWLQKEKAKKDAKRPKEPPSHKVQDPIDAVMKYRFKFVEKIKEIQPQVLEELRELGSNFEVLFSKKIEMDYIHILQGLLQKLIFHRRIYPEYEYSPINQSYIWGELRTALNWTRTYYLFNHSDFEIKNEEMVKAIIEDNKYTLQGIIGDVENAFKYTETEEKFILTNFLLLQNGIYEWIEKHNFQKDWLVEYAYYFINQFSDNKKIGVNNLRVEKRLLVSETTYYDFEFKSRGWVASEYGESAPKYKERVTREFEEQLNEYLYEATDRLGLDKMKKFTKPPTYQSVEWLVYSLVKKCDAERLVEKFYPNIAANRTKNELTHKAFESKKRHIVNEIKKLKIYGLPENENI